MLKNDEIIFMLEIVKDYEFLFEKSNNNLKNLIENLKIAENDLNNGSFETEEDLAKLSKIIEKLEK